MSRDSIRTREAPYGPGSPDDSAAGVAPEPLRKDERRRRPPCEKRQSLRFDKVFPVTVESADYGLVPCIARNVSRGGMFLELRDPLPLGTQVQVRFAMPDSNAEVVARAEVKNHYFLNYSDEHGPRLLSGMAVRFLGFEEDGRELLQLSLTRYRVLH